MLMQHNFNENKKNDDNNDNNDINVNETESNVRICYSFKCAEHISRMCKSF